MEEIVLSSNSRAAISIGNGTRPKHNELKNLGFDESGHTGFQKELTEEQLKAIAQVTDKENISNKVSEINGSSTDEQYPSAKAVFDAFEKQGDFELIETVTLEKDVTAISLNFDDKYKELYMHFVVPPEEETTTEKARFRVYTLNTSGTNVNKIIYDQGNYFVSAYSKVWCAAINIKMFGVYARTQIWFETANMFDNAYARGLNSSNYSGFVAPSVQTAREFLPAVCVQFFSANNIRTLPAGTTYSLWGVKK